MSETIHVRVPRKDMQAFRAAASDRYGRDHNDLLRELIRATADGRVRITPTEGQSNQMEELYNES